MSRLRRLLRMVAKPAVMAVVAGSVALSLIITTPSNAQAFVAPPVLPVLMGATEMAIPELMATSTILGPVGWGIAGATALGIGLYATRDYWLPYVTGAFGQPAPQQPSSTTGYAKYDPDLVWPPCGSSCIWTSVVSGYNKINATVQNKSAVTKDYGVLGAVRCKKSDGTTYTRSGISNGGIAAGGTGPAAIGCGAVGDTILYGKFGAMCSFTFPDINPCSTYSSVAGPGGVLIYGDPDNQAFDPKSPLVKYRVEAECIATDGTISFANGYSTGDMAGVTFPSCAAQGKGHATGNIKLFATPPNGVENPTPIWSITAPTAAPERPLCSPQRAGTGCKLAVQLDGKPCVVGLIECENWPDLAKDPSYTTRLSCTYGPYPVPMETCNPLEKAYRPGGSPATTANTDGDPGTSDENQPDGKKVPLPAPPVSGTVPGGDGAPAPAPAPAGTPEAAAQDCWPNGWSVFNPLEWVLKPIGCAFIPKQDVNKLNQDVVNKANTKAPVAWLGQPLVGPSGGGCPSWVINVGPVHQNVVCDSSFTAAVVSVRGPLFLLVATAMVWPLLRSLWYAAIPILRVTPSSGGKS